MTSVAVVLNVIGLETAQSQDYEAAFSCFVAAARHGYGKAQFNAGVCLEKGRGVAPDALQYYWQAASGGHTQAQYRYGRLLLTSRGQPSPQEWSTAVRLLEQAADAGLTQAQVFLGSVFAQEAVLDGRKSVHYLRMAAESSDGRALLHLGQCYAHGFGVQRNATAAAGLYARAARAGNGQAQRLLRLLREGEEEEEREGERVRWRVSVKGSTSTLTPRPHLSTRLPHSWSTGSLASTTTTTTTPPLHLHLCPLGPSPGGGGGGGGPCGWTLGV
ncbi:hypothetical protein CRUP_027343 [Coryphaenoides rupestris]|nr:hypothetical protein CRUP_027343 [Coryphaenoides rupestris]